MSATAQSTTPALEPKAVLSRAVARAAERLGISRSLLARVLGLSPATVSRLFAGNYQLDPGRKEWEFALLFLRAFRSLDSCTSPS